MLRMEDYNRNAKAYWWITAILGAVALAVALVSVAGLPYPSIAQIALGVVITGTAAASPLRMPGGRCRSAERRSSSSWCC